MSFDNRQHRALSRIIEDLQRLQNDPERLARERDQRYSESPPPYQSSGETTQPESPEEPHFVPEFELQNRRIEAIRQSTPYAQFNAQARRERERIIYQIGEERFGRRQTLPYDETQDLAANAKNNIRARWVEQGIWKEEWGPPWGKGAQPSDNRWRYSGKLRRGPRIEAIARWAHEKDVVQRLPPEFEQKPEPRPNPSPDVNVFSFQFPPNPNPPPPPPTTTTMTAADPTAPTKQVSTNPLTQWEPDSQTESETESVPDDAPIPDPGELTKRIFPRWKEGVIEARAERKKQRAENRKLRAERREKRRKDAAAAAAAYRLNPEASRPYHQFLYQVSKEREWIKDEFLYKRLTGFIDVDAMADEDVDAMAYEAVKKHWIEDKIWNPQWGELPGMTWMHADLLDKTLHTPDDAEEGRQISLSPPHTTHNGAQPPVLPNLQPFNAEATHGVDIDRTDGNGLPSAPADVDTLSSEISRHADRQKRTASTGRLRSADQAADRVLRNVRSSTVEKPGKPMSPVTKSYRKQNQSQISNAFAAPAGQQSGTSSVARRDQRKSLKSAPGKSARFMPGESPSPTQSPPTAPQTRSLRKRKRGEESNSPTRESSPPRLNMRPESRQQKRPRTTCSTSQLPQQSARNSAPNGAMHGQSQTHTTCEQPLPELRRSARIAQLQKARENSGQSPKAGITRKRKNDAAPGGNSAEQTIKIEATQHPQPSGHKKGTKRCGNTDKSRPSVKIVLT